MDLICGHPELWLLVPSATYRHDASLPQLMVGASNVPTLICKGVHDQTDLPVSVGCGTSSRPSESICHCNRVSVHEVAIPTGCHTTVQAMGMVPLPNQSGTMGVFCNMPAVAS